MKKLTVLSTLFGLMLLSGLLSGCGHNQSAMSADEEAAFRHTKQESPEKIAKSMQAVQARANELEKQQQAKGSRSAAPPPGASAPPSPAGQ